MESCSGSATYCEIGQRCVTDGCCPLGETCSGGGGTQTVGGLPIATDTPHSKSNGAQGSKSMDEKSFIGGLFLAAGYLFL
jgi:hypothetical protein